MLESCLTRLLGQIGSDTEIYVSDNASDPETAAVLAGFVDPRLRKSRNSSNLGLFQNLNHCLAQAAGEFVIFLSDDDFIDDDLAASCLALLQRADADPTCPALIAANRYLSISSDGHQHPHEPISTIQTGFYDGDVLLEQLWLGTISFQLCGILFRTEDLRAIGGFTTKHRYAGDVYTFAALFLDKRIGFLSLPKCTYVVHPSSETSALGMRYRMSDLGHVLRDIIATGKEKLPRSRSERLARSAHWYITTEYLRNVLDLYRSGAGRRQCLIAMFPSFPWMVGRGGRFRSTASVFCFEVFFPLWLKELIWTTRRLWRQLVSRGRAF